MDDGGSKCKHCGCEVGKRIKADNKWQNICRMCGMTYYICCDRCGELFSERHIHAGERLLCELCREAELVQCDRCGIYVEPQEARVVNEQIFCVSCHGRGQVMHGGNVKYPAHEPERDIPDAGICGENGEQIREELRRKVDLGAAALWLASEFSGDEEGRPGGETPRFFQKRTDFDWGKVDEEEYDADSDLY